MAAESKRGCGYRKVNALYLCSDGIWVGCDRLPLVVESCPVCGAGVHFTRVPTEINPLKLFGIHEDCQDKFVCHVCQPDENPAFLLGVGKRFYSPENFLLEAQTMGVSKRIPHIPKNLEIGKTWVYLMHPHGVCLGNDKDSKPTYKLAIFAAFCPTRVEMPVWESEMTVKKQQELAERGITPIPIPDGDPDHTPTHKGSE